MDKRIFLNCTLAVYLVGGFAVAYAQPSAGADMETRIAKERHRKAIDVAVTPPSIGISSGLVIVYGHPIPGPYKFEYRGNFLFVNGVQVEPSILRQHEYEEIRKKQTPERRQKELLIQDLVLAARKRYFENSGKIPDDKLHSEILSMVLANPLIRSAHWVGNAELVYNPMTVENKDVLVSLSFAPEQIPPPDTKPKRSAEAMRLDHIKELETELNKGDCIFFMSDGGTWHARSFEIGRIKESVNKIMNQPGLSDAERLHQISLALGNVSGPDMDIVVNYKASEWK